MKKITNNNEGNLKGIYALLASLFMAGIYFLTAGIDIGLPIVVFVGTLIACMVAGIIFPGLYKLYSVVVVAIFGTMVYCVACL